MSQPEPKSERGSAASGPAARRRLVMPAWQAVIAVAIAFALGHVSGQKKTPASAPMTPMQAQVTQGLAQMTDPEEAVMVANAHFDQGKHDIALQAYERAIQLGLDTADIRTDLGVCYRELGDPKRAVEEFRKAAELDPKHPQSRYNLGLVLSQDLGDKAGADAAWREFLRVAPNDPKAKEVREELGKLKASSAR